MPQRHSQEVEIAFPLAGVVENTSYERQPAFSTPEALNVMPYDTAEERARGGRRPGISKAFASAVNGTNHGQLLIQGIKVLTAQSVEPTSLLFSDDFERANGTILDSEANWDEYGGSNSHPTAGHAYAGTAHANNWEILAGKAKVDTTNGGWANGDCDAVGLLLTTQTKDSTAKYVIRVKLTTFNNGEDTADDETYIAAVAFRVRTSNGEHFFAGWRRNTGDNTMTSIVIGKDDNTTLTVLQSFNIGAPNAAEHDLEVRVNGSYVEVFWDGGLKLQRDMSGDGFNSASHNGLGFMFYRDAENAGAWDGTTTPLAVPQIDNFQLFDAEEVATLRERKLLAVSGGQLYSGKLSSSLASVGLAAGLTNPVLNNLTRLISGVEAYDEIWLCDGGTYKRYSLLTDTVSHWDASAGTLPGANGSAGPADNVRRATIIGLWNGRVVLAGKQDDPTVLFASRIGAPTDFDYAPSDAAAAFRLDGLAAGGAQSLGKPGDIITAIIPFFGNRLILGCSKTVWSLNGNPRVAGSTLTVAAAEVGIAGPKAWCVGPHQTVLFLGTDGAMYAIGPNDFNIDQSNKVSEGKLDFSLPNLDLSNNYIEMVWSSILRGVLVFVTPINRAPTTHYFWSVRGEGFFPWSFVADHGPTAALMHESDVHTERVVLLFGFDSFVRQLDTEATSDDGSPIISRVLCGPITWPPKLGSREFVLRELKVVLDEQSAGVTCAVQVGDTAEQAKGAAASFSSAIGAGRNQTIRNRARGAAAYVVLSASAIAAPWIYSTGLATIDPAGPLRSR